MEENTYTFDHKSNSRSGLTPEKSFREEIALRAMTALIQSGECNTPQELAEASFEIADAMIKENNK